MIIIATFTGKNGSLGYENGKEYELNLFHLRCGMFNPKIGISRIDNSGKCQYTNILRFLNNWTNVRKKV